MAALPDISKDEAYRIAMKELGELFGEYLIMANSTDPRVSEDRKRIARARANACQQAFVYFKEN